MKIFILLCALSATCFAERKSTIPLLKPEQVIKYLLQYQHLQNDMKANVDNIVHVIESYKADLLNILRTWIEGTSKHAYEVIQSKFKKINESLENAKAEGRSISICVTSATDEINNLNKDIHKAFYSCLSDAMKSAENKVDVLFPYLDGFRQVLTNLTITKYHCYSHNIPQMEKCLFEALDRYESNYYNAKPNVTQILTNINNDSDRIRKEGRICISTVLENTRETMKQISESAAFCPNFAGLGI